MSYLVLARRERPRFFRDICGQSAPVTCLRNAVMSGHVAHAYLFAGTRGTGKTSLARVFAKAINCENQEKDGEPCGICASCKEIAKGSSLNVIEIDGASNRGIEDIRQINETVAFAPSCGRYKVYIIDEVHMLTKEAFNALLKTLEEPPSHVVFLFATTEPLKLPATIHSRCQRFLLRRISAKDIATQLERICLKEGASVAKEALELIAEKADGSLRDALSLLDQLLAYGIGLESKNIGIKELKALFSCDFAAVFSELDTRAAKGDKTCAIDICDELFSHAVDAQTFLDELLQHFRTHLVTSIQNPSKTPYKEEQVLSIIDEIQKTYERLRFLPARRVILEALLLRIVRSFFCMSLDSILRELQALKKAPTPVTVPIEKRTQSHYDTLLQFAAVELQGQIKDKKPL